MKKQNYLFSNPAFFDIVLQQKVRQVGLSETRRCVVEFYHTLLRLSHNIRYLLKVFEQIIMETKKLEERIKLLFQLKL